MSTAKVGKHSDEADVSIKRFPEIKYKLLEAA